MAKKPETRALRRKEVAELLASQPWALERSVMSSDAMPVYSDAQGRGLVVLPDRRGRLWSSFAELKAAWDAEVQSKPRHVLAGRLPRGRDFPAHVPALVDALAQRLRLARPSLDGTLQSLAHVDAAIRRVGASRALRPPLFEAVVAYAGEVMRKEAAGAWDLRLAADAETWEPWIVDGAGRAHAVFMVVFDALYDHGGGPVCLEGSVAGELRAHLLRA
jgi:hypothetical protein